MFDALSDKLDSIFKKLRGQGVMTEENIKSALREVRLVLLEADVNFKVVKDFIQQIAGGRLSIGACNTNDCQSFSWKVKKGCSNPGCR